MPANKITRIHVDYGEISIANLVKAAGGKWNSGRRVWELAYRNVVELGLENRIYKGE